MEFDLTKLSKGDIDIDKTKKMPIDRGRIDVKDLIAPDAIETDPHYIKVGKRYMRTIMIVGYPRSAHIGWLNRLYAYGANIDISSHIQPLPKDRMIKQLNNKIAQFVSTQRMDAKNGKIPDITVEVARNDAETLRDALHKGQEQMYHQSIYINVAGKTIEELDQVTDEIETLCGGLGLTTRVAMFQQEPGFRTCLPIADDRIRRIRNFDTSSLATCLPIVSAELTNTKGTPILYGINMINGSLVLFDRFELPNYNSVTLATSGSGKSYFVKLEAIRYLALGANIIIIDPNAEYGRLAKSLGGQYIKLSSTSEDRINPLDIHSTSQEEDGGRDFLTQKILDVYSILEIMLKRSMDARERKIMFDALEKTYERFGITKGSKKIVKDEYMEGDVFLLEGAKKTMPTLKDLDQVLRQLGDTGIQIAEELDPYTHGFLNLFSGETNVDTNANFIVFDVKDMERELADVSMFVSLEFIWNKIKKGDGKKRIVIIDEAWMLMRNQQSSEYVVRVAKTARKFNAGLSIISQQVQDFLQNNGEGIIGNTSMQVLLRQSPNDIKEVAERFALSKSEQGFLKSAAPGEALIFANGNHTAVKVESDPNFEHMLCTTKPADLEKIKNLL